MIDHLRPYQREKIRAETDAFHAQKTELLIQYAGEYVAMHQGAVIDHDLDLRTLHLRVFCPARAYASVIEAGYAGS